VAKQSGLGDNLYVGGYDLSGDTQQVNRVGGGPSPIEVTGINKSAFERLGGHRDSEISWVSYWNPTGAHVPLSALPRTATIVTYCRGTSLGSPAASMQGLQVGYDPSRGTDGSLTLALQAVGDSYGLEWGVLHTAGLRTDTGATNGSSVDAGASSAFGLQAYLHVTSFTGTDVTVKLQESSDDGAGDAFADVTGGGFTAVTGIGSQRIATAADLAVERYLRVATTTSGGFTSVTFAVVVVRNAATPEF
jgi:hypothetical protein